MALRDLCCWSSEIDNVTEAGFACHALAIALQRSLSIEKCELSTIIFFVKHGNMTIIQHKYVCSHEALAPMLKPVCLLPFAYHNE